VSVLRALGAEILKMFAADLWLTVTAVGVVAGVGLLLNGGIIGPGPASFLLAGGILAALGVGVVRGARR
jgi:hypothetical protein